MNTVVADFTERAGTGCVLKAEPEAIQMASEHTALIVIDMQNAYTSIGGYLDLAGFDVSKTKPVVKNIQKPSRLRMLRVYKSFILKTVGTRPMLRQGCWISELS